MAHDGAVPPGEIVMDATWSTAQCPGCLATVRAASTICVRCGRPLRSMRSTRDLTPVWMAIVLVVAAVIVGAAWGLSLRG